jgi:hypothetical protein
MTRTGELEAAWAEHQQALQTVGELAHDVDCAVQLCSTALRRYRLAREGLNAGADVDYGQLVMLMLEQERLIKADY